MRMKARLSIKGQIILPRTVREKLGLKAGDILSVQTIGNDSVTFTVRARRRKAGRQTIELLKDTSGIWKEIGSSNLA
jgi:AbrB family looped-hinge helix DNA binding protein